VSAPETNGGGARRETLFVTAAALAARLGWLVWAGGRFPAAADGTYYDALARRLAHGDGYTWGWPDGAVTFAAHYPVGYPALLALAYAVFGASVTVAGVVNAALGALGVAAAHRLLLAATRRGLAYAGALALAVHPALVPYTSALMTEAVTASLLVVAAAVAGRARASSGRRAWGWIALAGAVLGAATLVRPQCVVLAPALGALALRAGAGWRARGAAAAALTAATLLCCAPWTVRNCVRMHRCALVSVNGGWNLLIGVQTTTGAWTELDVPPQCRAVWDEAQKDACFERAARAEIARAPGAWLARAPRKLAVTFDYFGAAPSYLNASAPAAFPEDDKAALGAVEAFASRALLIAALVACARVAGPRGLVRHAVAAVGVVLALCEHAWPAYLLVPGLVALLGARRLAQVPIVLPWAAIVIAATAAAHAAFFGAGRYGLVCAPLVALAAFVRAPRARREPPAAE
jgi:hypothetical protein